MAALATVGLMRRGPHRDGVFVVLLDEKGRRYRKQLHAGHRLTIRGSVLKSADLIGAEEGRRLRHRESFCALRPSYAELATLIERPAEPVFAKDAGAILIHADVGAGDRVIEVGVGAGLLTLALLRAIGSQGRLVSYELREDFAQLARENVAAFHGDDGNWILKLRDAAAGFDERDADRVVVDVPEPARLIPAAAAGLRAGGRLAVYLPTVPQVQSLRGALARHGGFTMIRTIEVFERGWNIEDQSVRPEHRMVAHTAFLTFATRFCPADEGPSSG